MASVFNQRWQRLAVVTAGVLAAHAALLAPGLLTGQPAPDPAPMAALPVWAIAAPPPTPAAPSTPPWPLSPTFSTAKAATGGEQRPPVSLEAEDATPHTVPAMNPVEPDPAAGAPRAASPPDNAIEPLSSAAFAAHPPSAPADPEPTAPIEAPPEPHAPPWPASATLHYEVEAQSRGLSHQARASLRWRAEADLYELELSVRALWLQRSQTSQGQMGPRGLRPLAFVDRGRRERQLTMEWHENGHGRAVRSEDGAAFALPPLTQDRLSLFAHLGLQLLRTEVTSGQRWSVSVAGFNAASMWTFEAVQRETLPLPSGPTPAWRLQRLDSGDPELTLWYAPELAGPLPVRVRLREPNGTLIDQSVRDVKIEPRS